MSDNPDLEGFWGEPGDRPFHLTEGQVEFCILTLEGKNQTQAAHLYSDPPSAGTHCSRSQKVKAALAAYKAMEEGAQGPITNEEIIKHLTDEVRHGSG